MERLALIGVSHRRGGADALADWHERYRDEQALAALGLERSVVLATCNRFEAVVHLPSGVTAAAARDRLADGLPHARATVWLGEGALERVLRIAAGLDSLNPGEDQIMRQVRHAYREAREAGRTDALLAFTFERALQAAKRIRREVALAPVHTSLFSLARPELERTLPPGAKVLVLGAGEMGELAARSLRDIGMDVTIANRTESRAHEVARRLGCRAASLASVASDPPQVRALVCATPVRDLVQRDLLTRSGAGHVVDLGVPRNVAPSDARAANVILLDVDALRSAGEARRAEIGSALAEAERLVREELDRAVDEWNERRLGPAIRALRDRTYRTLAESLPEDQARQLVGRLVHDRIKGLRALAREHGVEVATTYLNESGLAESDAGGPA